MFSIEEELKKLPHTPGVYLMHDKNDQIIYVGKAIDLYNRVHQYFQVGYKRSPKIEKMVSHIAWFEYIICGSEIEALVLECNLIKEHRPHYNTMLTDDKGYPYIQITVNEDFPRILYAHQMKRDHSTLPHGGFVIRNGKTGWNQENTHVIEYRLKLDSNPEFTSCVIVCCARAAVRMKQEGMSGCKTILDIPPAYLSAKSGEELRKNLL